MSDGTSFWKIAMGVGCGLLLAVGAMFLGCVACVGLTSNLIETIEESGIQDASEASQPIIEVLDWKWVRDKEWVEAKGQIRNKSNKELSSLRIVVSYLDSAGELLATDTFSPEFIPLGPGQQSPFDYPTEWVSGMDSARIQFRYEGKLVAHVEP